MFSTAKRVLQQLSHDPRTIAMLLLAPCLLMTILKFVYNHQNEVFQHVAGSMLGVFPMLMMFLITSVTTLRERVSGTLERLLISPMTKGDFIGGYAIAFTVASLIQATFVSTFAIWALGLKVNGSQLSLIYVAILDALLGLALGLTISSFAQTEFQALQFMPAFLLPQLLISGLLMPRQQMPRLLDDLSNVMPLSYAIDATKRVLSGQGGVLHDSLVIYLFLLIMIIVGSLTLKRVSK
jgi:ABC transporter DrrB family efflux protein